MPRFEIKGKGRETGRPRKRIFKAGSEQQARALAENEGFVVESATLLPDGSPEKRATRKKAVATKKRAGFKKAVPKPSPAKAVETVTAKSDTGTSNAQEMPVPAKTLPESGAAQGALQTPAEQPTATAPPTLQRQDKEPIARPDRPTASRSGEAPIPPWIGLREGRGGCLPVMLGALGLGLLYLLQLQIL